MDYLTSITIPLYMWTSSQCQETHRQSSELLTQLCNTWFSGNTNARTCKEFVYIAHVLTSVLQHLFPVKIRLELSKGNWDGLMLLANINQFRCNNKVDALPQSLNNAYHTIIRAQWDKASIIEQMFWEGSQWKNTENILYCMKLLYKLAICI